MGKIMTSSTKECIAWLHSLSDGQRVDLFSASNGWVPASVIKRDAVYSLRSLTVLNETDGTSCNITFNPEDFEYTSDSSSGDESIQQRISWMFGADGDSEDDHDSDSSSSYHPLRLKRHKQLRKAHSMVAYHEEMNDCWKETDWNPEFRCTSCRRMCCKKCMAINTNCEDTVICKECFISMQYRDTLTVTKWLFQSEFGGPSTTKLMEETITIIIAMYSLYFECQWTHPQKPRVDLCTGFLSLSMMDPKHCLQVNAPQIRGMVEEEDLICHQCWKVHVDHSRDLFGDCDSDSDDSSS